MHWLYTAFQDYAKQKNMRILKDDMKFIEKCLRKLPQNEQREVMRAYCTIWNAEVAGKNLNVPKQNYGRFKANCYLRDLVEKKRPSYER